MKTRRTVLLLVCAGIIAILINRFWLSDHPTEAQLRVSIARHEHSSTELVSWLRTSGYRFSERQPTTVDSPELREFGFSAAQIAASGIVIAFQVELRPEFELATPLLTGHYLYERSGRLIAGRSIKTYEGM